MASKSWRRVSCAIGWRSSWSTKVCRDASGAAGSMISNGAVKFRTFWRAIASRATILGPSGTDPPWAHVKMSIIGSINEYSCTRRAWSVSIAKGLAILLNIMRTSFQRNNSRFSKFAVDFHRWGTSLIKCREDAPCSLCTSSKQIFAGSDLFTYSIVRFALINTLRQAAFLDLAGSTLVPKASTKAQFKRCGIHQSHLHPKREPPKRLISAPLSVVALIRSDVERWNSARTSLVHTWRISDTRSLSRRAVDGLNGLTANSLEE